MDSLKNFSITFVIALLIFGLLALFLTPFAVQSFQGGLLTDKQTEQPTPDADEQVNNQTQTDTDLSNINGSSFTILIAGVDYLPDSYAYISTFASSYSYGQSTIPAVSQLSDEELSYDKPYTISADAILLLRIDKEEKTALLLSIPNNARVVVAGNSMTLGSVLTAKGIGFFRDKITALTGLPIDYYVLFTPKGFINTVNQLGGVRFDVPQDMVFKDPADGSTVSIKAGQQTLTGKAAFSMLRYVAYTDGNVSRMQLARSFGKSLLDNLNIYTTLANAPELFRTLSGYVYSDMTVENFMTHVDLLFSYDKLTYKEIQLPGQPLTLEGTEYIELDEDTIIAALRPYR